MPDSRPDPAPTIRVLALCVFRSRGRILVGRAFDPLKQETFCRPLGGEVEFGESTEAALRREMREELGVEIERPERLGVLENRFTYAGEPGHEIVFVYDAGLADPRMYDADTVPLNEPLWGGAAIWLSLDGPRDEPLYPEGLRALLEARR